MIKQLRRKFILIAMSSIAAVLVIIVGTLNIVSYHNMVTKADTILDTLEENNGRFPTDIGKNTEKNIDKSIDKTQAPPPNREMKKMSLETPYETRFFTVHISDGGEITTIDTGRVAAIETGDAALYAQAVWEGKSKRGFYHQYRYRVVEKSSEDNANQDNIIIFVDCSRDSTMLKGLLGSSVLISAIGLLAVFILVLFFSKRVFLPVAKSYEKQKQFITDASHELKTPLSIISANVEVLEMEVGENTWIKSILKQIERMNRLVKQMVMLSSMEERDGLQEIIEFSLSDAVIETTNLYTPMVNNQNKKLNIQIEEGITFLGDEALIRQMITILMDNALKYSCQEGEIICSLRKKGKRVELLLWNSTEDIAKGNWDILLERFYRMDSSRSSSTGGTGIGLSIAKSIVDLHGGRIHVNSQDGQSLQVEIKF